jgi:hypothetical protein
VASVVLSRAFLSDVADLANPLVCYTAERSDRRAVAGQVRVMANGRRRVVTRAGDARDLGMTLRLLTPAQVETLAAWRGRVVLFRDVRGRRVFGTFFDLAVRDYADRSGHDVTLTLTEVTYDESA